MVEKVGFLCHGKIGLRILIQFVDDAHTDSFSMRVSLLI